MNQLKFLKAVVVVFCLGANTLAFAVEKGTVHVPSPLRPIPAGVAYDDWKGPQRNMLWSASVMTGLGILDSTAALPLVFTGAHAFKPEGFIPDVNDSFSGELLLGPLFQSGSNSFLYSLHGRWDFIKDQNWTFFGLGGLGGAFTGKDHGDSFRVYPRFGVGLFYFLTEQLAIRSEVSHELIGLGVAFHF